MLKVYTDAAVNGNPGLAGIGIVITGNGTYQQLSFPLSGQWDNHLAEWEAMKAALHLLVKEQDISSLVLLYTDSQVVARSIEKKYVKNEKYKSFLTECLDLLDQFAFYEIHWIPEKQNKGADNLAKQGLQKSIKENSR